METLSKNEGDTVLEVKNISKAFPGVQALDRVHLRIKRGEVQKVVIEYPDRLARFGFEYLKFFMESFGVELIVLNGKENEQDVNKELAEDLIAIVTSFAARIYGQRGGKRHDNNTG